MTETALTLSSISSGETDISGWTNSNDSSNGSGEDLMRAESKNSVDNINILAFSPLKKVCVSEVAVPMFTNHESSVQFSPPVRFVNQSSRLDCGERMLELLRRLPDYEQFQPEIVQNIYVPKKQKSKIPVNA